jgi:hypothetical protein
MDVATFSEIEADFMARVRRIVWCTAATVDGRGRPRTRILHPIWEGATGWIATTRHSLKEKHLARTPFMSLTYWDPQQEVVSVECRAEWDDRIEERRRIWELFKATPPPLGYDPGLIWPDPEAAAFGLLRLVPSRFELSQMLAPGARRVWRA